MRQALAKGKRADDVVVRHKLLYSLAFSGSVRPAHVWAAPFDGHVAEWLRSGLQIRAPRFDSGRGLHLKFQ